MHFFFCKFKNKKKFTKPSLELNNNYKKIKIDRFDYERKKNNK